MVLERIRLCTSSKVMRILTEEALEEAEWILRLPASGDKTVFIMDTPEWKRYVQAVTEGYVLDTEYKRFQKAKNFADELLEHTYLWDYCGKDYKTARYEYAMSPGEAPAWFQTDKAALWVEEIVTAYCFLVFSVLDFAEEYGQQAS